MNGMSMAWMRMPGQTWPEAAAMFVGMWDAMMVAMMLPSLVPMLSRYRKAAGGGPGLTALAAAGYFFVWTLVGMAAFPPGAALAALEMQEPRLARAVPFAAAAVVVLAGVLQLTAWKARQLDCCRETPGPLPANARTAWRHGVRLGLACIRCCAGPTAVLLAIGVMDLRAMAVVTAAITAERLTPAGARVAQMSGVAAVGAGLFMMAHTSPLIDLIGRFR
ncbi:MAG TPA: DUF2182 domain-containing protein [Myxococcales bacterium]|jgi:predicted metal-binding membrane protein|nr:DUF2182 domain-containing protein [Myxococcales bacterium]